MIRDQVVDGCKSTEPRQKLLAVENLTLDKVRKIARTYELSVTHRLELFGIPSHNVHFGHNDSIALFDRQNLSEVVC
jgi:hypothetical protein